jgi:hypothetical protein
MVIYNITFIVEESISTNWLQWMKDVFIPTTMGYGLFNSHRILKVVDSPNEGETFCLQYEVDNLSAYEDYQNQHAASLHQLLKSEFGNQQVNFTSIMQTLD